VPLSVNPLPAVKDEEGEFVSAFPITNDEAIGVNEATESVAEPPKEPPVEVSRPAVVAPLISYIETDPTAVIPNEAVTVSAPELPAVAYQM